MEFTAIAFKEQISLDSFELIKCASEKHGFTISKENRLDLEVEQGLIPFLKAFSLETVLTIECSESMKKETSFNSVAQELTDYFIVQKNSLFLDFLITNIEMFPKIYYLIFAFEWHERDKIRFEKVNIYNLEEYFKENNSWYLWLYDYINNFEQAELDVPMIFEIENTSLLSSNT